MELWVCSSGEAFARASAELRSMPGVVVCKTTDIFEWHSYVVGGKTIRVVFSCGKFTGYDGGMRGAKVVHKF